MCNWKETKVYGGQTGQGQNVHEFMNVQTYAFPETRFPQDVGQEQPEGRIRRL